MAGSLLACFLPICHKNYDKINAILCVQKENTPLCFVYIPKENVKDFHKIFWMNVEGINIPPTEKLNILCYQ